ncbi:MAG: LytTR family transcriptional regulator DNA-binding domain-containing protein [Flavobacteriaceae bacterium]|nr:LytTR family transcriptional regulator DNA-binding domain-containing protein [Flavobacteriaceae bacterium]
MIDRQSGKMIAKEFKIQFHNILFATSFNIKKNYLKFIAVGGVEYYKRLSLKDVVSINDNFIFIAKDTIVNISKIDRRYEWIYLWSGEYRFKVSRHYRQEVKTRFDQLVL